MYVFRKTANASIPTDQRLWSEALARKQALNAFWEEWFRSEQGHFKAAFQSFATTDEFEQQIELLLRQWLESHDLLGPRLKWPKEKGSPFRGLEPFEAKHAAVFFGRERVIEDGRQRLVTAAAQGTPFLLVVGASGSGKSSLARAGLVPRLTTPGVVDAVDIWRAALMKPGEGQAGPLVALAAALFATLPELQQGDFPTAAALAEHLQRGGAPAVRPILGALARVAQAVQRERHSEHTLRPALLLLVDQLEELFAQAIGENERTTFVAAVKELAATGQIWCIATLRADFYELMLRQPLLKAFKEAGASLDLGPPGAAELAEIVRAPAAAAGLEFEQRGDERLDDVLLAAAGGNTDALPLLGFTLQRLHEHLDGDRLTFAAYKQFGGLEGAIGRSAEKAFNSVPPDAQDTLPRLLRGLAETSWREVGFALRNMPIADAPEGTPIRLLVDALIAARILLVHGQGQGVMLRLAHDAVLRGWERARGITNKEQDFFRIRADVVAAEQRWHSHQRHDLLLGAGLPLAEAQSLRERYGAELDRKLVAFIVASVTYHEAEADKRRRQEMEMQSNLLAQVGESEYLRGNLYAGLKLCVHAARRDIDLQQGVSTPSRAAATLAAVVSQTGWRLLLGGHEERVTSALFSPDGARIVTASADTTARIWDAATGKEITVLRGHGAR